MKDITEKRATHREAIAEAKLIMPPEIRDRLQNRQVEKGDALEVARVAGIMAAKKTPDIIPLCHPLMLTEVTVTYIFENDGVRIQALVKTIGSTGVEMEALAAASLTALTLYDMLKQYSHALEIIHTRLLSKTGGKSGNYLYEGI